MTTAVKADAGRRPSHRLVGIEAGRGIAATLVVLYHVARHLDKGPGAPALRSAFQFGHAGVDFFFVLSGFIILFVHYNDIGNPLRLPHYVARRFTRLMPTYWVALALTIALAAAGAHVFPGILDLLRSATLLPSDQEPIVGVAWTLQFEVLFYTLFAVMIVNRPAGFILLGTWFLASAAGTMIDLSATGLPPQFYGAYALEFFFGMAAAFTLGNCTIPKPRLVLISGLVLFGTAALLENFRIIDGYLNYARLAYGIPAAVLVLGIAEADRQSILFVPSVLRRIGAASYSIYLFQFLFIGPVWRIIIATGLDHGLPVVVQFLILTFAAVAGGIIVSDRIEYPLMRRIRNHRGMLRAPEANAP
jgi:exopolysaccharide production protein ExoZ